MRDELDRGAMATLSGGHLAVDFSSGAVPALLPFFVRRVRSQLHGDRGADARGAGFVLPRPAAVRAPLRPTRRDLAPARGRRGRRIGTGLAAVAPRTRSCCCSSSSRASGSRPSIRRARSSPRTRAGTSARAACRTSTSAATRGYALGPILVTPLVLWLGLTGGLLAMLPVLVVGACCCAACPRSRARARAGGARAVERRRRPPRHDAPRAVIALAASPGSGCSRSCRSGWSRTAARKARATGCSR